MFYLYQDESLRTQHNAVRTTVGWYDFTHRLFEVTGPDALKFLNKMYLSNLDNLAVGRARYTPMLDEDGWICDDVIIFRLAEDTFWVSTLYGKDLVRRYGWYIDAYDVAYVDRIKEVRMFAVQGPKSPEVMDAVIDGSVEGMKFFSIKEDTIGEIPVHVARAGYTGEKWGFELYVPEENVDEVMAKLDAAAAEQGGLHVTEIDAMAMTLPAEAGYYLMLDLRRCTPYEVGFDSMVDFKKDFVGKRALRKLSRKEPARELVGIEVPDYDAVIYGGPDCKGNEVFKDGKHIGYVTKFTYGYTVEKNIGYALVKKGSVELGDVVKVNNRYDAIITPKKHLV